MEHHEASVSTFESGMMLLQVSFFAGIGGGGRVRDGRGFCGIQFRSSSAELDCEPAFPFRNSTCTSSQVTVPNLWFFAIGSSFGAHRLVLVSAKQLLDS